MAARRTFRCVEILFGAPNGRPIGKCVIKVLGRFIASSRSRKIPDPITIVAIPLSSINRAICPTDTWQTGQTGTNKTASILCSWNMSIHLGALCFCSRICEQAPINEYAVWNSSPIFHHLPIHVIGWSENLHWDLFLLREYRSRRALLAACFQAFELGFPIKGVLLLENRWFYLRLPFETCSPYQTVWDHLLLQNAHLMTIKLGGAEKRVYRAV